MSTHVSGLAPRWASPPGETIASALLERDLEPVQLAATLDLDADQMRDLLAGRLPITIRLARALSASLGGSTEFWIAREAQYHDDMARVAADKWAESLPTNDMVSFGWIGAPKTWQDRIEECLGFFGVEDLEAFDSQYGHQLDAARFRTSATFGIEPGAATVWFRACERAADAIGPLTGSFDAAAFSDSLPQVKRLTREMDPRIFIPSLVSLCASAGVAVVVVRAPRGCPASGAARRYRGRPLIQLSGRHLSDDHLWFTFFHEAAHVLLHDLDSPFVDVLDERSDEPDETDANTFATEWLIGRSRPTSGAVSRREIVRRALKNGVAPGIVVGQLQHLGIISHSQNNGLKRRYYWKGTSLERRQRS